MKAQEKIFDRLIRLVKADRAVLAIMLFGSRARKEGRKDSDIDVCLVLKTAPYTAGQMAAKRLKYAQSVPYDIHIYQLLPIYIRTRVIKDGKVIFCRDEDELYRVVFRTLREYSDFEHIYRDYLKEVASGG